MAMGFPAIGCEALYRNSLAEVKRFFECYHKNKIKVYNLCLETEKIYPKSRFPESDVGFFPFSDHQACPTRLMLEFCVDLLLYLSKDTENVAAVHCKAGKGRTGIMICCYLIFSGICYSTADAIHEYSVRRSHYKKGVEIASQKRYIRHFETFLSSNFEKPYTKIIPKIVRDYSSPHKNILVKLFKETNFSNYKNLFKLKSIKIGPFVAKSRIRFLIENFKKKILFDSQSESDNINFKLYLKEKHLNKKVLSYTILEFNSELLVDNDINIKIISKAFQFNFWINFFYINFERYFIILNEIFGMNFLQNVPNNTNKKLNFLNKSIKSFENESICENKITSNNFPIKKNDIFNVELSEHLKYGKKTDKDSDKERNSPYKPQIKIPEKFKQIDSNIDLIKKDNFYKVMETCQNKNPQNVTKLSHITNLERRSEFENDYEQRFNENICDNKDSITKRIEITEYELNKKIKKVFTSNVNIKEGDKSKSDEDTNINKNLCKMQSRNKSSEEMLYKNIYACDDDNKYSVYNNDISVNDNFYVYNLDNLYDKILIDHSSDHKERKIFIGDLQEKLFNLLFRGIIENLNKLDIYDINYLWRNDIFFNNQDIIKFLIENSIFDGNPRSFQHIDLNKIYNLMIKNLLKNPISAFFKENKFKIKLDTLGVDKFSKKRNMLENFQIKLNYTFE